MKILFITSNRLGDAVLSTGILSHIIKEYNDSEITVACGYLAKDIFALAPNVKQVIVLNKKSYSRHWFDLWKKTVSTKWDIIIDIRNSAVSRLLFGKNKFIWHGRNKDLHKVEQMSALLGLPDPYPPKLWFSSAQKEIAKKYIADNENKVLAIGPAANWVGKTWPEENFIDLVERLTCKGSILHGYKVAVFAAPSEENVAYRVLNSISKKQQIDVIAKLNPLETSAVLSRSSLYIGNDSGLMHCAAAVGIPTIGLFGPGYPDQYKPWGEKSTYVQTPETADALLEKLEKNSSQASETLMKSLTVDEVEKTVQKHWKFCTA